MRWLSKGVIASLVVTTGVIGCAGDEDEGGRDDCRTECSTLASCDGLGGEDVSNCSDKCVGEPLGVVDNYNGCSDGASDCLAQATCLEVFGITDAKGRVEAANEINSEEQDRSKCQNGCELISNDFASCDDVRQMFGPCATACEQQELNVVQNFNSCTDGLGGGIVCDGAADCAVSVFGI